MPSLLYDRRPGGRVSARLRINGVLKHLGTFDSDEEAMVAVRTAKSENRMPTVKTVTVAEWAAQWQRLFPGKRNEATAAHNAMMVAPFVRVYGERRLSDIDVLAAQAWAVAHPSHVKFLGLMFSKACTAKLLGLNVWAHVEVERANAPRVPPTPAGLELLVGAARARGGWFDHFADCILFTAYCGARGEEVQRVQTADVLEAGARVVLRGKRRPGESDPRARVVAVFGPGRAALRAQMPQLGRVWRAAQGGPLTQDVRERQYKKLMVETGLSGTFHGLRHFCTSWLLDQGASKQDVAVQLGHRDDAGRVDTTQVERVYGHMAVEPALLRLEAVTSLGGSDEHGPAARGA